MQYRVVVLLLLSLTQLGCGLGRSLVAGSVRYTFSREHSCPEDRLAMHTIPVDPHELLVPADPPPDVAADPGRLSVWRTTAWEDAAEYTDLSAIRVQGCGVEQTYLCWDKIDTEHDDIDYFCKEMDFGSANLRLGDFTLNRTVTRTIHEQLVPLD